ncbi:hypothetical protein VPH35_006569 [Triticum aestivum]
MVSWDDLPSSSEDDSVTNKEVPECRYVESADPERPDALKMSLDSIWTMYEEEKKHRLGQNVVSAEENLKVLEEKKKMENELSHFKLDFAKLVAEKEEAMSQLGNTQLAMTDLKEELEKNKMIDKSITNIHQVFRVKAEKERDQAVQERDQVIQDWDDLKHEKRNLEYMTGDLFKHKEATKEKIKKLKGMLNEFD